MKAIHKIIKALVKKGWTANILVWEPVSRGPEGREGGWYIELDDEEGTDETNDQLQKVDTLDLRDGELSGSLIIAYNLKAVLEIIDRLPVFVAA